MMVRARPVATGRRAPGPLRATAPSWVSGVPLRRGRGLLVLGLGGDAVQALAVVPARHAEPEECGQCEADGHHDPAPGQTRVGLGVVVEDRANAAGDLPQRLELREEAVETGERLDGGG